MDLRNYKKSFEYLEQGINASQSLENNDSKFGMYHGATNVHLNINSLEQAKAFSNKATEIADSLDNDVLQCYANAQKIHINNQSAVAPLSINYIENEINACRNLNLNLVMASLYRSLGMAHFKMGNAKLAMDSYIEALNYLKLTSYPPEESRVKVNIAEVLINQNQYEDATRYLSEVLVVTSNQKLSKEKRDTLYLMSKIESVNNIDNAFSYLKQANALEIDINEDVANKNLAYMQVKYSNFEKDTQLKILDQENELLKLNSEVQEQSKRIYQLFSIVAALLISLIILMLLRVRKQKERYQELSRKDGLTGVLSRRYVLNLAKEIHNHSLQNDLEYSLVVFDLDYFKSINDKYGHAIGDWVLKEVTQRVTNETREGDAFGRLGGEEFVLVLPNTRSGNAKKLAKRCLEAIKTIQHEVFEEGFVVTASFGVATYPEFEDLEALIQNADDAMYKAKQMGRNQIFSFAQ